MDDLKLKWSNDLPPSEDCHYNHSICNTPFGRFLLTWKGWKPKGSGGIGFDETPWGEAWYGYWNTPHEAKIEAEKVYAQKLNAASIEIKGD